MYEDAGVRGITRISNCIIKMVRKIAKIQRQQRQKVRVCWVDMKICSEHNNVEHIVIFIKIGTCVDT
jgi:hypothetical protein